MEKDSEKQPDDSNETSIDRRKFIKGAASTVAAAAAAISLEPLIGTKESSVEAAVVPYNAGKRAKRSFQYRVDRAKKQFIDVGVQPDNGDVKRFRDYSGNYSKALRHDALGIPNADAFNSMRRAFKTGKYGDFQRILVGTPGGGPNSKLNGPQGALAFELEGLDSHASVIPPAPSVASDIAAAEMVEHYWAALLRDVPFTEYPNNPLVNVAVEDMNKLSYIRSNRNYEYPYPVTPQNLFRGQIYKGDGNVMGPYLSQFLLQPTFMGTLPIGQKIQTFLPGQEFMTTVAEFQRIQNGQEPSFPLQNDLTLRFPRDGRDLAAYTRSDILFQAYLIASVVLPQIGPPLIGAPLNPGNPYLKSETEKPFFTLGAQDAVATMAEMATRVLKAAWFQKWIVNLRLRPEEYGALIQARLTNTHPHPKASEALNKDVLDSAVLPLIYAKYGSYLLPQAFPEGSPTHPCYPTGHGTVAGACLTALKFFYDGSHKIRPLLREMGRDVVVPSPDGLTLLPYTGADSDLMDINGEFNKLAFNISFGHGIHAGIHFRSSTYWSILLGEQIAISVLKDRVKSYNEPFNITITKFDGTKVTFRNPGNDTV